MFDINERITSNVSGRTYIITWASPVITQAEVGFAKTDTEGESYFVKRLLSAKYCIPKGGKPLSESAKERNRKSEENFARCSNLYHAILNGCGEGGACVPIIDCFRDGSFYYTVYRKINASSLSLKEIASLSESDKYTLLLRLVQGLQPLHVLGVIHGDLKPDNILVQREGDSWRIRLIDMNDCYKSGQPNEPGAVIGTPEYYSPELSKYNTYEIEDWTDEMELRKVQEMAKTLTPKSDVFALGIIFHEFYTGMRPVITDEDIEYIFEAANAGKLEVSPSIPEDLSKLISSMLDPDYTKRPNLNEIGRSLQSRMIGSNVTEPTFSILHLRDNIFSVEILTDSSDVDIYYTTDGSEPSVKSSKYRGALELKKSTTVRAVCVRGKRKSSVVTKGVYLSTTTPLTVSRPPVVVVNGKKVAMRLDEKSPDASIIYYTLDGSEPMRTSNVYSCPFVVGGDVEVVKAMAVEPGERVRPSSVVSAKVYKMTKVSPPEIKKVFMENAFDIVSANGCDIYYTLDGTTPTIESKKFIGTFSVEDERNFIIKAVCIVEGVNSDVVELSKSKAMTNFKTK